MALGDLITAGGQAIQDLFGSSGATAEANSYNSAAQLADQNAQLTAASTRIQQAQTARQIFQTEGSQLADVAGAGFTESGSALDLLRSSASQGSLATALTNIQGAINENAYASQAGAYRGAAASANEHATANTVGAIAAIGGALVNNSSALLSAGRTVVNGISSVYDSIFGDASDAVGTAFTGGASGVSDFLGSASDSIGASLWNGGSYGSSIDQAIAGGSNLSQTLASFDIGVDTSGIGIGTDLGIADTGIGNFLSSISDSVSSSIGDLASLFGQATDLIPSFGDLADSLGLGGVSDLLPGIGWVTGASQLLSMIPGWNDIPVLGDITSGINSAAGAVTGAIGDAVGAVAGAIGDVGSAIGDALGSVICTAYAKLGFIRYRTWIAASDYGRFRCSHIIFNGYWFWAKPLASQILKRPWLAKLLFPIFKPVIYEMASIMGVGKSTIVGKLSLKFFRSICWTIGIIQKSKRKVQYAIKARA